MRLLKQYAKSIMEYKYPTECILCKEPLVLSLSNVHGTDRYDKECAKCLYYKSSQTAISNFKVELFPKNRRSLNSIFLRHNNIIVLCYPTGDIIDPESRIYKGSYYDDPILTTPFIDWNWEDLEEFQQQLKFMVAFA